jgi:hypothetical protein
MVAVDGVHRLTRKGKHPNSTGKTIDCNNHFNLYIRLAVLKQ